MSAIRARRGLTPFLKYSIPTVVVRPGFGGFMVRAWFGAVACFIAPAIAGAAAPEETGRESLHATLWMQVSPEYRAIAQQVYRQAEARIAAPLPDSAALEQA